MPEGIEVEYYKQTALQALNRKIKSIEIIDHKYLMGACSPAELKDMLIENCFIEAQRKGKLLDASGSIYWRGGTCCIAFTLFPIFHESPIKSWVSRT